MIIKQGFWFMEVLLFQILKKAFQLKDVYKVTFRVVVDVNLN